MHNASAVAAIMILLFLVGALIMLPSSFAQRLHETECLYHICHPRRFMNSMCHPPLFAGYYRGRARPATSCRHPRKQFSIRRVRTTVRRRPISPVKTSPGSLLLLDKYLTGQHLMTTSSISRGYTTS